MRRSFLLLCSIAVTAGFLSSGMAQESAKPDKVPNESASISPATEKSADTHPVAPTARADAALRERTERLEGEKRFRTNCSRCHMAPHKFPPRIMATAIRHMRVRAMITDEDMRLILKYMTQ